MSTQEIDKSPTKPTEGEKPKEQTITLSISELSQWSKKSKQLTQQVKVLTEQNTSLKEELGQAKKKQGEIRKNDNVVQGLEQTIKQLQKILDDSMTSMNKMKKENSKLQDDLNLNKQMLITRQSELVGLRETSSDYFLLKQEVNRLESQVTNLKTGEAQITNLKTELQQSNYKLQECQEKNVKLNEQIEKNRMEVEWLTKGKEELDETIRKLTDEAVESKKQRQILDERIKEYEMRMDDISKESELSTIKYIQEIKDLKELYIMQKEQKERYQSQAKQQQQVTQIQKIDEDLQNKDSQYLLTKIQQLQTQNAVAKYMMNQTSSRIQMLQQKLKTRTQALLVLCKEYSGRWPNLQQSDGLQYVDNQILKQSTVNKNQMQMVQLVQRCVIQNLRLKYMMEMIGSEYNNQLRKKEFS